MVKWGIEGFLTADDLALIINRSLEEQMSENPYAENIKDAIRKRARAKLLEKLAEATTAQKKKARDKLNLLTNKSEFDRTIARAKIERWGSSSSEEDTSSIHSSIRDGQSKRNKERTNAARSQRLDIRNINRGHPNRPDSRGNQAPQNPTSMETPNKHDSSSFETPKQRPNEQTPPGPNRGKDTKKGAGSMFPADLSKVSTASTASSSSQYNPINAVPTGTPEAAHVFRQVVIDMQEEKEEHEEDSEARRNTELFARTGDSSMSGMTIGGVAVAASMLNGVRTNCGPAAAKSRGLVAGAIGIGLGAVANQIGKALGSKGNDGKDEGGDGDKNDAYKTRSRRARGPPAQDDAGEDIEPANNEGALDHEADLENGGMPAVQAAVQAPQPQGWSDWVGANMGHMLAGTVASAGVGYGATTYANAPASASSSNPPVATSDAPAPPRPPNAPAPPMPPNAPGPPGVDQNNPMYPRNPTDMQSAQRDGMRSMGGRNPRRQYTAIDEEQQVTGKGSTDKDRNPTWNEEEGDQMLNNFKRDESRATLRPRFGIAAAKDIIPSAREQLRSDLEFDLFSVVKPGYGEGVDNKQFLYQKAHEDYVRFAGPFFSPGVWLGPLNSQQPLPWQWQTVKSQSDINNYNARIIDRRGKAASVIHSHGEGSANVFGRDIPEVASSVSSSGLPRDNRSPFEPVIQNKHPWTPDLDPAGYLLGRRGFKRTFSALRDPDAHEIQVDNGGPHLRKRRSLEVILP